MKLKYKYVIGAVIVLAVGGVLVGTRRHAEVTPTQAQQPISVGAIFSLTGNGAAYGEPARDGARMAVDAVNAAGGIQGRSLELKLEDSQFDPKVGVSAYEHLRAKGVRYFVSNGSGVSAALAPIMVKNGDLEFETGSLSPAYADGKPNTCRAAVTAIAEGEALAGFLKKLQVKSVGFLTVNNEYGNGVAEATKSDLRDVRIVQETFGQTDTDFRTQASKLVSNKPDALVVLPLAGQAEAVFRQLKELGWSGRTLSDNWTIINPNIRDLSLIEGVYFSNYAWLVGTHSNDGARVQAFKQDFKNRYGYDASVMAALAYDAVTLTAKGMVAVGTDSPVAVGEWLTQNVREYPGVVSNITLNVDCESDRPVEINKIVSGQPQRVE